ncbi:MAG: protoporphyrinogen oxidase [Oryzihumus sp.]
MASTRVAVVGGGISGLAAAWQLVHDLPGAEVVVLDASDRPGGKLRSAVVGGVRIDVGAESMLARRPEGLDLATGLGLAGALVHPATTRASVWSRGALHPMPGGTLMGVPANPAAALGLLDAEEIARDEQERDLPVTPLTRDVSVGDYVAERVGPAVVDRLVEPLLGGVYAGHARLLSLQATVPALWQAAVRGESLTVAAERAASAAAADGTPVFAGLRGGMATLAESLHAALVARGVRVVSDTIVRSLERTAGGWRLVTGPAPAPVALDVDAVVLAVPAAPAARLLAPHSARASAELGGVDYASMAIVSLVLPRAGMPPLPGSGFLVPPVEGRTIKASTFSGAKWGWVAEAAGDLVVLRASIGRHGEEADLQRADQDLVAVAHKEVGEALGGRLPAPVDAHVQRWGGALPQYAVGHVDRVARIGEAVAGLPGLEVAGAAYQGVGIPACIGSGRAAALAVATHLKGRPTAGGE